MPAVGVGRPPDFVGVGVQRSGTSWWYRLITAHPACSADPDAKELHFFDRFWAQEFDDTELAAYHSCFDSRNDHLVGEWTPRYLYDPWVAPLLRRAAPDARLLVMLRDPVQRYRSGLRHSLDHDGWPPHEIVAIDAFHRGLYGAQLARLYAAFPPEQVLVLQYERCATEPHEQLTRTYEFLGLDPSFVPGAIIDERVLATSGDKAPLPAATAAALAEAYADDLTLLSTLTDSIDLSLWPTAHA